MRSTRSAIRGGQHQARVVAAVALIFAGQPSHPVALALQPTVRNLPEAHFQTVIEGMADSRNTAI